MEAKSAMENRRRHQGPAAFDRDDARGPEERFLLHELAHRINNELASTIGLLSLAEARSSCNYTKHALAEAVESIHGFVRVNRALQMPEYDDQIDASVYLQELLSSISQARLRHQRVELVFVEHAVQLGATQCWCLGMIVYELVTNASRHAFGGKGGTITIDLQPTAASVNCCVSDNGSAPKIVHQGQGTRIIQYLASSLNGTVGHLFTTQGTTVRLSFPIAGGRMPQSFRRPS